MMPPLEATWWEQALEVLGGVWIGALSLNTIDWLVKRRRRKQTEREGDL